MYLLCGAISHVRCAAIGAGTSFARSLINLNGRMFDTKFKAGLIDIINGILVRRSTMDRERNLTMTYAPDMEILVVEKERMNE